MNITSVITVIILILSVVVHEFAHAWTADRLGDKTARYAGRLTLNPFAHLDPIGSVLVPFFMILTTGIGFGWAKPVPYNPYNIKHKYGDALVAVAGPLSNLLIACIASIITVTTLGLSQTIAQSIVVINIVLMLFNLIPVPPLDGSKIIAPLLPYSLQQRFLRPGIEQIAFIGIAIFLLWPIVSPAVFVVSNWLIKIAGLVF